jgi:hypothetical protein
VRASLTNEHEAARVRVEYTLSGAVPGSRIPATVLTFGSEPPTALALGSAGEPASFSPGPGRAQVALLPVEVGNAGEARVVAEYTVPSPVSEVGGALRGHIPVLSLDRVPQEAQPGLFHGEVNVPAGWTFSEAFPTGLSRSDVQEGAYAVYAVDLSVVPATLSFRAYTDGAWHPGLPLILDVLAALIVVGFSFAGWRHLREPSA